MLMSTSPARHEGIQNINERVSEFSGREGKRIKEQELDSRLPRRPDGGSAGQAGCLHEVNAGGLGTGNSSKNGWKLHDVPGQEGAHGTLGGVGKVGWKEKHRK